ncbi:MAG: VWA domain-containing protein, partial [Planctomycetes bacterium]|nr:VWA domain-containing protein [Planctomycetota bacterium]
MNAILRLTPLGLGFAGAALAAAHGLAQESAAPAVTTSVVREVSCARYGWSPGCGWSEAPWALAVPPPANPLVEIAICLDTSGSMDGLIGSAKQKLWAIVNEFVFAEPMPRLRVALYTYGNDGHSAENGWVNLECPLTEDLDLVSERLFAQTTNGGTELVGRVVNAAAGQLDWSPDPGALKLIVVAGNETADQDTVVSFRDACAGAIARDIMVDAIYCGAPGDGDAD